MGCNYFMTPVAADLFSLYALENIGNWIESWASEYAESVPKMKADVQTLQNYDIPHKLPIGHGWVGYSVQQYYAKTARGKVRGVQSYEQYRKQIPMRAETLQSLAAQNVNNPDLGIVPNMFSMVPLAQAAHSPISGLAPSDGVRGAQVSQQARYVDQLDDVFSRLSSNSGLI
jgi:hypothetical protein